jgi:hypothetical protein
MRRLQEQAISDVDAVDERHGTLLLVSATSKGVPALAFCAISPVRRRRVEVVSLGGRPVTVTDPHHVPKTLVCGTLENVD